MSEFNLIPTGNNRYRMEVPEQEIIDITPAIIPSQNSMFKNKYTIGISAGILILIIGTLFSAPGGKSPEELRMAAAMARIEAMKEDCKTITERVEACFLSETKNECKQMQESTAWFTGEYGWSPDFACSTVPDPLAFGAGTTK